MSRTCQQARQLNPLAATIASAVCLAVVASAGFITPAFGQSVCLPAPRLLTTMPMGGQAGTDFEIAITGQYIEEADELRFSDPRLKATPARNKAGEVVEGRYLVSIPQDVAPGLVEATLMTRLGLSASRVFSVGVLPEIKQAKPNHSLDASMSLAIGSVCNAAMTARAVDFYQFHALKGQRILVDCAAKGIDSKLNPVVLVADAQGRDLAVERRGGAIDFSVPEEGDYVVKVHDLTFKGGTDYFYRLVLRELQADQKVVRHPSTQKVNAFSWPPEGLADTSQPEVEPNEGDAAQRVELPFDISGSFATAADTDVFEFFAKAGDVWWVEVASERLGRPTDPTLVIQHVDTSGESPVLTDVVELNDIPSPIKVSSNGYAYDGPPYNAGSSDVLGKFEVKQDGLHRLRLTDLFGGTRNDPANVYRLIVRKATPDFSLVAWAMHMQLRNGDRNALSKPIALRGGATMALDVVALRRDGFDGEIELSMQGLPDGVTAHGLTIPAGKSHGVLLVTADEGAPRGISNAVFTGTSTIGDQVVSRTCHMASMAWPITNHWNEVPCPRLLSDILVSVGGDEPAPITIAARDEKTWEARQGEKIKIPLIHMRRGEFSGSTMAAKALGAGFERVKFDLPLDQDSSEAVLDLASLKTPPGEYLIAFYGGAVAKYQHYPRRVEDAKQSLKRVEEELAASKAGVMQLTKQSAEASAEKRVEIQKQLLAAQAAEKLVASRVTAMSKQVKAAVAAAKSKDIVDIVVSKPIKIRVLPAEAK
ncbi:MAG: serine protease [Rubripirellula sp.]